MKIPVRRTVAPPEPGFAGMMLHSTSTAALQALDEPSFLI
jgi:hypothetical protein